MTLSGSQFSSRNIQPRPQAVFSQVTYTEAARAASQSNLTKPSGSGLQAVESGSVVPLVFCRRTDTGTGGVFLSPEVAKLSFVQSGDTLTRRYWMILTSGDLDSPSLTLFYGDSIQGSGILYYNTPCPFTPEKTVTDSSLTESLPEQVGDDQGTFSGVSCVEYITQANVLTDLNAPTFFQPHVYTNFGVRVELLTDGDFGASNLFSDLIYYLMTNSNLVPTGLIDRDLMGSAGLFTRKLNMFYDGVLLTPTNLRTFIENGSFYFLLFPVQRNGKWGLKPRLPVTVDMDLDLGVITPVRTFTADDIIAGSFRLSLRDASDGVPFAAVVTYRIEEGDVISSRGTVEERFPNEAIDGPFERFDMTDFCTREDHATLIARYILAKRRWVKGEVVFETTVGLGTLEIGDIIDVDIQSEFNDGTTDQILWVFQVVSISESQNGVATIVAEHFPLTEDGRSLITDQIVNELVPPLQPVIGPISINANERGPADGEQVILDALTSSQLTDLQYLWSVPAGSTPATSGQDLTLSQLSWVFSSATDFGDYGLTISSPTALDSPQTAEPVTLGPLIGNVTLTATDTRYGGGETMTIVASYDGPVTDVTWSWSGPAGTNAPIGTTSDTLTWTTGGVEDEGIYVATATSPTAADSPQSGQAQLTYSPFLEAVGGTITYSGDYKIHTFTSNGNFTVTWSPGSSVIEYLIVGSGGPGSPFMFNGRGGGGGGGGVVAGSLHVVVGSYFTRVGTPRAHSTAQSTVNQSSIFGLTALAGGEGSSQTQANANGGCGGGGPKDIDLYRYYYAGTGSQGGNGSKGVGSPGGNAEDPSGGGGGGAGNGGAGAIDGSGNTWGGAGGQGLNSSISGASYVYASGGGGAAATGFVGEIATGGVGGTGAGNGAADYYDSDRVIVPTTASTNYGAGGGGGAPGPTAGIQGIVIVRYLYQ